MKIAVTGATGFIGRHVLAELARHDVEVIAGTRDSTCLSHAEVSGRVVEFDIAALAEDSFEVFGRPDVLVHLAWEGLPNYKSLRHFEVELPRQYCFLKRMIESGLPSLLITGTCFEYGMQTGRLSEKLPTMPNNPYGQAKDALRKQLEFLKATKPFNFTWARLFYLYGAGQSKGSLYPQLAEAVRRGDSVFNMSGGEQLRDYLPVSEVARVIVDLALARRDIGLVNICSGTPISVRRLVEQWIEDHKWEIQLNLGHYPYPDYEPMAFWGDATKIATLSNEG
jgi:dTDP-6-deoxy-L-talose 4-dehydrogenase (NAD+)